MPQNITTVLISQGDKVYRPAGYRRPEPGELYVAKDGRIKKAQHNHPTDGDRLIVRELSEDDFATPETPLAPGGSS